jgi:hypothetical protein
MNKISIAAIGVFCVLVLWLGSGVILGTISKNFSKSEYITGENSAVYLTWAEDSAMRLQGFDPTTVFAKRYEENELYSRSRSACYEQFYGDGFSDSQGYYEYSHDFWNQYQFYGCIKSEQVKQIASKKFFEYSKDNGETIWKYNYSSSSASFETAE